MSNGHQVGMLKNHYVLTPFKLKLTNYFTGYLTHVHRSALRRHTLLQYRLILSLTFKLSKPNCAGCIRILQLVLS